MAWGVIRGDFGYPDAEGIERPEHINREEYEMTETADLFSHETVNTSGEATLTVEASARSAHPVNPWLYG